MKRMLFGIICAVFVSTAYADIGVLDSRYLGAVDVGPFRVSGGLNATVTKLCVDGYKYIHSMSRGPKGVSTSLVQAYEVKAGKTVPAKCSGGK